VEEEDDGDGEDDDLSGGGLYDPHGSLEIL
jgi:hypothetical protein